MKLQSSIPQRASNLRLALRTQTQLRLAMLRVRAHLRAVLAGAPKGPAKSSPRLPPRHVRPFRFPPEGGGVGDVKPSRRPLFDHQNSLATAAQCPPEVYLG